MNVSPNKDILKWCREYERLSLEDVEKKVSNIGAIESGESNISLGNLRKLANLYKRPLPLFFKKALVHTEKRDPDFRTVANVKFEELLSNTYLAVRDAQVKRANFLGILDDLEEIYQLNIPKFSFSEKPEEIAKKLRKHFDISKEVHLKLEGKNDAQKYWINILEAHGVLVFQYSLSQNGIRGFCLEGDDLPPTIVLNSSEFFPAGRIFTLFHELCHILLKEDSRTIPHEKLEKFCNRFAGAFLVPEESLQTSNNLDNYLQEFKSFWLSRLAGEFKVSQDVILIRLAQLEYISQAFCYEQIKVIEESRKVVLNNQKQKEKSGFLDQSRRAYMNTGKLFTNKLLNGYESGLLGKARIVEILNTTNKSFAGVRELAHFERVRFKE